MSCAMAIGLSFCGSRRQILGLRGHLGLLVGIGQAQRDQQRRCTHQEERDLRQAGNEPDGDDRGAGHLDRLPLPRELA